MELGETASGIPMARGLFKFKDKTPKIKSGMRSKLPRQNQTHKGLNAAVVEYPPPTEPRLTDPRWAQGAPETDPGGKMMQMLHRTSRQLPP